MPKTLVDLEKLETFVAPVCDAQGVELVDVHHQLEQGGPVLRVLIEVRGAGTLPIGVGGVTLDDCTRVSRALSALLDEKPELIPGAYRLEVSSPGIERPLVKPRDFERFAGREAHVQIKRPISERKNFTGTLVGLRDGVVVLRDDHGTEFDLPLLEIAKAHLVYRF
jgi:ribosome maturation factor RimP